MSIDSVLYSMPIRVKIYEVYNIECMDYESHMFEICKCARRNQYFRCLLLMITMANSRHGFETTNQTFFFYLNLFTFKDIHDICSFRGKIATVSLNLGFFL